MEQNHLYTVVSSCVEQDNHKICIMLNVSHPVYKGHFPGQPILPGACALQIVRECVGTILNRTIRFKTIKECKFTSMIVPSKIPIELLFIIGDGDTLRATVLMDGNTMLKLKSTFTDI